MNIIRVKITSSTNLLLKELSKKKILKEWTVIVSDMQTKGRGQNGNHWESEFGKNIICSILLHPNFLSIKNCFLLSKVISLSLKKLLEQYIYLDKGIAIKWPNDLYFNGKKIAGILIENELINGEFNKSIVGIGLNVNQEVFTKNVPNPISLKQIIGKEIDLDELLKKMIKQIRIGYEQLKYGDYTIISQDYHQSLHCKNGLHNYRDRNGTFLAKIRSVGEDGLLSLTTEKEEKRSYFFKEVTLVSD